MTSNPAGAAPSLHGDAWVAMTDRLATPLLLLSDDGVLLHANAAAHAVLATRSVVVLDEACRVLPAEPAARPAFTAALRAAGAGSAARRWLHWRHGGHTVDAVLTALGPTEDPAGSLRPVPLVLSLGGAAPVDTAGYAACHRLTAAERRVLAALLQHGRPCDIACALGCGLRTVRSHLGSIRRKTGHGSVAELRGALARLPPVRG